VRQAERQELYAAALAQLADAGLLYRCWCTRAEIRDAASAAHGPLPEGAYPGTCRDLSAAEVAEREARGRPPAWRVRAQEARVTFTDRVCGEVTGAVDDFVVRRNDGAYAYNLAVVVDDAEQSIGEVVRGDDLLDSTPRQLWLGARLGLAAPAHAHVPLMLGPDQSRLAKRHGAVTLAQRAALGQSPAEVRRELLAPFGLANCVTMDELVNRFDPALVR
jgi:glutamyl-tRNA synthetase